MGKVCFFLSFPSLCLKFGQNSERRLTIKMHAYIKFYISYRAYINVPIFLDKTNNGN